MRLATTSLTVDSVKAARDGQAGPVTFAVIGQRVAVGFQVGPQFFGDLAREVTQAFGAVQDKNPAVSRVGPGRLARMACCCSFEGKLLNRLL